MCYSAMARQDAKKLALKWGARIEYDLYDALFSRRLQGEKLYVGKGIEAPFLTNAKTPEEKAIGKKIREWHASEVSRIEKDLFAQKKRLADAIRILESGKPTKKAENDKRIATDKIEKFKRDLDAHNDLEKFSDSDSRIYPLHYVSMLTVDAKGERIIMPIRYHMRPADKDASFDRDYFGCYNARFDNLSRVAWWKNVLGKRHGIILVTKFYENVDPAAYAKKNKLSKEDLAKKNLVLAFEPGDGQEMIIPVLWDKWTQKGEPTLYSGALITDEPNPEVAAAGHDRTPIFLKESAVQTWLTAKGEASEIKKVLMERETVVYKHRIWGAA